MNHDGSFFGKRVTVMGLGLHGGGVSVAAWLMKHGARALITDLKPQKELTSSIKKLPVTRYPLRVTFVFGHHRKQDFIATDMVVRNPAVPIDSPFLRIARQYGVPIENEATLFFKHCKSKNIIGVTGTRGKSTTAAMIATILKRQLLITNYQLRRRVWLAGNIRTTPMLSIVDRVRPNDWVVLELSSWHLEDMDREHLSSHVAVVTNLLQDHLNRYSSMRSYSRAKEAIVRHQKKGDIAVLNYENPWTRKMAKKTKAKVYWFNNYRGPSSVIQRTDLRIVGAHNFINAQAAATVARAVGVHPSVIRDAMCSFRGLPDRLEYVRTIRGVRYYNDTTATTPDATIAALRTLVHVESKIKDNELRIILIAGGSDKRLNYKPLIPWIKKTCKALVLLPGSATKKIQSAISNQQSAISFLRAPSMRIAIQRATALAVRGDTILLSPAAASFGLFQHEFDRGEKFRAAVAKLRSTKQEV